MLLKFKILIGVVVVAVIVAVGVTLGVVLSESEDEPEPEPEPETTEPEPEPEPTEPEPETPIEDICETSKIYLRNKRLMDEIPNPHFLKQFKNGPPEMTVKTSRAAIPKWAWLSQNLDHFNPRDTRSWEMRYLYNGEFYEEGGPIFIFLGGEWEISFSYLMTGQMYDLAREHKGYMFYTEHRYYGKSIPTEDLCTESLQYLSADQALGDIVYFIEYQKTEIPSLRNSKVVVVGGSYSATLATWARVKYPHVIDAALSSSAPLLAIEDFYQYYEVVTHNINLISGECIATVEEALDEILRTLETDEGVDKISSDFISCKKLNVTEPSKSYFFTSLISPFGSLVQYANSGDIKGVCDEILNYSGSSYEKFRSFIRNRYAGYCIGDYEYFITYLDYPLVYGITRQWYYQTCTEYGFYQTTASDDILFGKYAIKIDLYRSMCEDVFGITPKMLQTGIERTNHFYGALEPSVTKVVSIHGTVDPWHSIGVLEDVNAEAPVFVVEGTSHCADLTSESSSDLPKMLEAKRKTKELITQWITN